MRPEALQSLTVSLYIRFIRTGDMGDTEAAIEHIHEALKSLKSGHFIKCTTYHDLTVFLSYRFRHRGAVKDITDAIKHH